MAITQAAIGTDPDVLETHDSPRATSPPSAHLDTREVKEGEPRRQRGRPGNGTGLAGDQQTGGGAASPAPGTAKPDEPETPGATEPGATEPKRRAEPKAVVRGQGGPVGGDPPRINQAHPQRQGPTGER